jgi:hypothetical protein
VRLRGLVGALQERLGQRRPVVRLARLFADQVHARALPRFRKAGAELGGSVAAADDDDGIHVKRSFDLLSVRAAR